MSDEYRIVTFTLLKLNVASIILTRHGKPGEKWESCPRSCLHGGDDLKLAKFQHSLPHEVTVRMFAWKADELHLA